MQLRTQKVISYGPCIGFLKTFSSLVCLGEMTQKGKEYGTLDQS
jgi:hypothetical protein